jgi:hypothetical protein
MLKRKIDVFTPGDFIKVKSDRLFSYNDFQLYNHVDVNHDFLIAIVIRGPLSEVDMTHDETSPRTRKTRKLITIDPTSKVWYLVLIKEFLLMVHSRNASSVNLR